MPSLSRPIPAPRTRHRSAGLTLIELMVAMALLGVIGILTWRATSQMVDARIRIGDELSRWQAVVSASALIERELMQIAPAELTAGASLPGLELETGDNGSRLAWTVVGGEHALGRIEIRHRDRRLEAIVWPDRDAHGEPVRLPLLEGVEALRWRLLAGGETHAQWPTVDGRNRVFRATALPEAVEFTLELTDVGPITRVFALR